MFYTYCISLGNRSFIETTTVQERILRIDNNGSKAHTLYTESTNIKFALSSCRGSCSNISLYQRVLRPSVLGEISHPYYICSQPPAELDLNHAPDRATRERPATAQ